MNINDFTKEQLIKLVHDLTPMGDLEGIEALRGLNHYLNYCIDGLERRVQLSVDIIIEMEGRKKLVLVGRKYPPSGIALPGGHVEPNETTAHAARREAREETGLDLGPLTLLGVYSKPGRDPRKAMVSLVYVAEGIGTPIAGDDAGSVFVVPYEGMDAVLVFDHNKIVQDYVTWRRMGLLPPAEET